MELKEIGRETEFEVTLENLGNQQRSYFSWKVLTSQDVPVDRIGRSGKVVKEIHATEIKGSSIHLSEQSIQLGPKRDHSPEIGCRRSERPVCRRVYLLQIIDGGAV